MRPGEVILLDSTALKNKVLVVPNGFYVNRLERVPKDMKQKAKEGPAGWIRTTWLSYTDRISFYERGFCFRSCRRRRQGQSSRRARVYTCPDDALGKRGGQDVKRERYKGSGTFP